MSGYVIYSDEGLPMGYATLTPVPNSDPIPSRIAAYQSDLARLDSRYAAERKALTTRFTADIKLLANPDMRWNNSNLTIEEAEALLKPVWHHSTLSMRDFEHTEHRRITLRQNDTLTAEKIPDDTD